MQTAASNAWSDEPARLDHPVEGAAVDDEVFDHRERPRPPGLDVDHVTVVKAAHVQLTGRRGSLGTVGNAIDNQPAGAADTFAAVVVERDRLFVAEGESFVQHVEDLKEGHLR